LAGTLSTSSAAIATEGKVKLARLRAAMAHIVAIDFFGANGREAVDGLIATLDARVSTRAAMESPGTATVAPDGTAALKGRVWVTREGVHVDRIASAWLIRRFIDPGAGFKFVSGQGYRPRAGELRFDMFEAEFTHEGDHCTFEVLLTRTGLADPALAAIAEIVHDIDLKDGKFGREETSGIAHLIAGLAMAENHDSGRIERGGGIFNALYEYFRTRRG